MPEEIFDTTNNSPETSGHEEVSAEENLEQKLEQVYGGESGEENSAEEQPEQVEEQESQEKQEERLYAGKYRSPEDLERAYKELESKLGERDELAQQAKQIREYFEKDPDAALLLRAKQAGLINQESFKKLREYFGMQQPEQPVQNTEYNQRIQQMEQIVQNLAVANIKREVESDYSNLQKQYGQILEKEGLNVEGLTQIAIDHNLYKQGEYGNIPDVEKALRFHLASNPSAFEDFTKILTNAVKQSTQKTQQEKLQARVESSSVRQQEAQPSPADFYRELIKSAETPSGSGF